MASNLTQRLAHAAIEQQKESADHWKQLARNMRSYYRKELRKLKADIVSKDSQLSELTDLIANQQTSLEVMQMSSKQLKIVLAIMTGLAIASVALLLITAH